MVDELVEALAMPVRAAKPVPAARPPTKASLVARESGVLGVPPVGVSFMEPMVGRQR